MSGEMSNRRPLVTRHKKWAVSLAEKFVFLGITPNQMSLFGVFVTIFGCLLCAFTVGHPASYVFLAGSIQIRLLCNMLDGLMAVEHNRKTKTGPLYNEIPDRVEDVLFFVCAGFISNAFSLGIFAALAAVFTAYVRMVGASFGFEQDFSGPMAKQHRMFFLTLGCLGAIVFLDGPILLWTLVFILFGTVATIIRRTVRLYKLLAES